MPCARSAGSGVSIKLTKIGKKSKRNARHALVKEEKTSFVRTQFSKFRLPNMAVFKNILGFFLLASIACVLLLGLAVGALYIYRFATTSSFFATKHIEVLGNERISKEMLQDLTGIKPGDNSLAVSITRVERELLQTPWVEEVSVKRLLPGNFIIRIKERLPSYWVRKAGVLYYTDAHGKSIAPVETTNFLSLPTLQVEQGSEDVLKKLDVYLKHFRLGKFPIEIGAVSSIHVSPGKGIELYLEDREMRLSLAYDDWAGNVERLGITLADLARRGVLGPVREVRAADGNVWVINSTRADIQ